MSSSFPAQRGGAASLSASQLRMRYIVALSLIAVLTIASQLVMQFLIADQKYDSRVVNIAGRQRMLSQKITKLSYYILNAESPDAAVRLRRELGDALSLWQRSHAGLLQGDSAMGLPGRNSSEVVALFGRIQSHHDAIVAAARTILASSGRNQALVQSIHGIREHESSFLKGMDDIVFRYDHEANAKVEFAKWLEFGLMGITLMVLLLEAAFIFAPATRRIERDMQELAVREEDLERLFAASPTALLLVDAERLTILRINDKAADLMGFSSAEMTSARLQDYLDQDYATNRVFLEKISSGEDLNEYEVVLLDSRRSVFESLVSARTIGFSGQSVFVLGITNISELKKAQQTLEYYATFDEMTGLVNRRTGLMMLGKSMGRCNRHGGTQPLPLTVCFVDLDGLKIANDNFGHEAGDWLIRSTARVLGKVVRSSDAAARLGGDEFLLILPDCSIESATAVLARAQSSLIDMATAEKKQFPVSFSYGIVGYSPDRHATADDLIAEADSEMYRAKQGKRRLHMA